MLDSVVPVMAMVIASVVAGSAAAKQITAVTSLAREMQRRAAPALTEAGQHCAVSTFLLNRPNALALLAGLFGEDEISLGDRGFVIVRHRHNRDTLHLARFRLLVHPVECHIAESLVAFEDLLNRARRPILIAA